MSKIVAEAIVIAIIDNLGDRRGVGQALREMDDDVYEEIRASLISTVANILEHAQG